MHHLMWYIISYNAIKILKQALFSTVNSRMQYKEILHNLFFSQLIKTHKAYIRYRIFSISRKSGYASLLRSSVQCDLKL